MFVRRFRDDPVHDPPGDAIHMDDAHLTPVRHGLVDHAADRDKRRCRPVRVRRPAPAHGAALMRPPACRSGRYRPPMKPRITGKRSALTMLQTHPSITARFHGARPNRGYHGISRNEHDQIGCQVT
jgi:hypothetical protein